MKGAYYFRRGLDMLQNQGLSETLHAVIKLIRFLFYRWSSGISSLKSMQIELKRLPEDSSVEKVYSTACSLGAGTITPMQDRDEFTGLLNHIFEGKTVRNILEIGTCGGGSLFCFCRLAEPDALVISVDLPGGVFGGGSPAWKQRLFKGFAKKAQSLHLLRLNSHDQGTYERVVDLLAGRKLDFLFIDGDHTFEGVKQDFEMYSPLVKPGGVIGFHDTLNDAPIDSSGFGYKIGVGRYWRSLRDQYQHWEFEQSGRIGIGLIQLPDGSEREGTDKKW